MSQKSKVRRSVKVTCETLESRRLLAAVNWTGGGDGINWTNAANWSSNPSLPGAADDVTINVAANPSISLSGATTQTIKSLNNAELLTVGGGATLNVTTTASSSANVTLTGATVGGNGTWTFSGGSSFNFTGGNNLIGLTINGDLTLATQSARTLISGGTTFTSAHLSGQDTSLGFAPGSTLNSTVLFEGTTGTRYVELNGSPGTFTVGATGVIKSVAGFTGTGNIGPQDWFGGAMTLVNNGLISAESAATLNVRPGTLTNNGNLQTSNSGTTNLQPTNPFSNAGTITVNNGTLNLLGTFNTTSGIGTWSRTGGTVNVQGTINNTGNNLTLNSATGSWVLAGGTISGGQLSYANSQTLIPSNGLLTGLTINGDLTLANQSARVKIEGGTTFTSAHLSAQDTSLGFAPGSTLNSTILFEGTTGTRYVEMNGAPGTFTIGATGAIKTVAGFTGTGNIGPQDWFGGAMTLVNNGTISSESASTLNVRPASLTNTGTIQASNSGTINLQPTNTYTNGGTFAVNAGTFNLLSTFDTTGGIGTWSRTGGTVNILGTITNTGNNLTLNNATGSWVLAGGTISGGQLSYANSQTLIPANGGILNALTINGDLTFANSGTRVRIEGGTTFTTAHLAANDTSLGFAPGATLNGTILFENGGGTRYVELNGTPGMFTIGATGTIKTVAGFTGSGNIGVQDWFGGAMTLVNNGLISAESACTFNVRPATLTNTGNLQTTNGGTVNVQPTSTYTNPGTFTVNNGTLNLLGTFDTTGGIGTWSRTGGTVNIQGTINNTGNNLTLNNATGSWTLLGGTISGGQLSYANSQTLIPSTGLLTGLTINGDLTLALNGAHVRIEGNTSFVAAHLATNDTSLGFAPGSTLNNTILFEGTSGTRYVELNGTPGTFTIGASGSIKTVAGFTGTGNIGVQDWYGGAMTLVNQGLISSETSGAILNVRPATLTNNGTLRASNSGVLTLAPTNTYTNAGTIDVNNGTLNLQGTFSTTGGIGTWSRNGGTVNIQGTISNTSNSFTLSTATGSWTLLGGTITGGQLNFANSQTLIIGSGGGNTLNGVTVNGDLTLNVGGTRVLILGGTTFANLHLGANDTSVGFAPGSTLTGTILFEGTTGTRYVEMNGTPGTFTISATGAIKTVAGFTGFANIGPQDWFGGAMTLVNQGLISSASSGETLTVNVPSLTVSGTTQILNNGLLNVDGTGTTIVTATGNATVSRFRQSSLTIAGSATTVPNGTTTATSAVNALVFNGSGKFDLNNNDLIVDYTGATVAPAIQTMINAARNGGVWTGAGSLTSTSAKNASPRNTTLGMLEATEYKSINVGATTWDGIAIDNTAVLVKYTYYGDTDFNGVVNFDDYSRTDTGFNGHKSGWLNGDFDGNGVVNFDDYSLIDLAFNTQGSPLRPAGLLVGSGGARVGTR